MKPTPIQIETQPRKVCSANSGVGSAKGGVRICWILLFSLLGATAGLAQTSIQREYVIKTGVLYNLLKYVDWPGELGSNSLPALQIGLLGNLPYAEALDVLQGKTVHGRKLQVKRVTEVDAAGCQVLFISASEKARLQEIIDSLKARPILTVSEIDGFAERGGMVNLVPAGNRVALEVNREAAGQAGFQFSSQLLRLAKIYPR